MSEDQVYALIVLLYLGVGFLVAFALAGLLSYLVFRPRVKK